MKPDNKTGMGKSEELRINSAVSSGLRANQSCKPR